jgi:hypothetical protein
MHFQVLTRIRSFCWQLFYLVDEGFEGLFDAFSDLFTFVLDQTLHKETVKRWKLADLPNHLNWLPQHTRQKEV